jgi:predicted dehydrogenase
MSKAPRVAIVGVGSIGSKHIDNLLSIGYQDLVGVDPRPMPREERLPIISAFCDLGPWKPTHALICSPPDWHYHHAKYFIDRGIPTFIEKPMTVSKVEATELCVTAHLNKAILAVGYMERAHPVVEEAEQFIEQYGCLKAEICCYWQSTAKTYNLDTAKESSHAIDLALYLLGQGRVVVNHTRGSEVTVVLDHASEAICTIRMNMQEWPRRVINLLAPNGRRFYEMYGETNDEWEDCYKAELQAFLNGKPLCTGEDGLRVVGILEELK